MRLIDTSFFLFLLGSTKDWPHSCFSGCNSYTVDGKAEVK